MTTLTASAPAHVTTPQVLQACLGFAGSTALLILGLIALGNLAA